MLPEIFQEWQRRAARPGVLSVMSTRWTEQQAAAATQALKLAIFNFLPPLNQSQTVLEIGCGIGRFTQDINQKAGRTYGIDISPNMLHKAQSLLAANHKTLLLRQPAHRLSFPVQSFDLVFEVTVLPHIVSDSLFRQTLAEMARVTKPDGFIFLCNPLAEGDQGQQLSPYTTHRPLTAYQEALPSWDLVKSESIPCVTDQYLMTLWHRS